MKIREAECTSEVIDDIRTALDRNAFHLKYAGYGSGLLSVALFYSYYSKFRNDEKYASLAIEYVEKSINAISLKLYDDKIFYFREIIEIGLFVQFVKNEGLLTRIDAAILDKLDKQIGVFMRVKIQEGELNHFGAMFAGEYFLTRVQVNPQTADHLTDLVDAFEKFAIKDEKGYSWKWPFAKRDGIYLGMVCGSSRVITLLSAIYENNIRPGDCHHIIDQATDFLLHHEQKPDPGYFPAKAGSMDKANALLDGDLSVACGLWNAWKVTKREDVKNAVDRTLDLCCIRHMLDDCGVSDASILYGTTGLALRFDWLYTATGEEKLRSTADFWYAESIRQRKFDNETAGFMARYNQGYLSTNIAFHEGIAGIGIGLMCFLDKDLPLPTMLI
ncbi:hypothetical protein GCM10010967_15030 [Dyadobacter beijingensis]|uniref:Lanthionine synthetase-like protein n=1 Tax=Dyadobacter beijingensis TaxID=365489 RepID=A0ABQ2HK43_9BACT|nr:lanthionine synthetase LanC family protein [Dyadobacter beijingensis]GGM84209.1 hypothetical protein GCM10010967_15030 [Dyadobacter beijingensis]